MAALPVWAGENAAADPVRAAKAASFITPRPEKIDAEADTPIYQETGGLTERHDWGGADGCSGEESGEHDISTHE